VVDRAIVVASPERADVLVKEGGRLEGWATKRGALVCLTAEEAVRLGMASAFVNSRQGIHEIFGLKKPGVVDLKTDEAIAGGEAEVRKREQIWDQVASICDVIDREYARGNQLAAGGDPNGAMVAYRICGRGCGEVKRLGRQFPGSVDSRKLSAAMNAVLTAFESARLQSWRLWQDRVRAQQTLDEIRALRDELQSQ
jgi:hypothetical protein